VYTLFYSANKIMHTQGKINILINFGWWDHPHQETQLCCVELYRVMVGLCSPTQQSCVSWCRWSSGRGDATGIFSHTQSSSQKYFDGRRKPGWALGWCVVGFPMITTPRTHQLTWWAHGKPRDNTLLKWVISTLVSPVLALTYPGVTWLEWVSGPVDNTRWVTLCDHQWLSHALQLWPSHC